ncbi:MAG: alpha/beta hydrolase [Chitinophagales bacterium]|nr:alpha/beta hydrolase [Chitinophagales bacterium]
MKKILLGILALVLLVPIAIFFLRKDNVVSMEEAKDLCETKNSHYFEFNGLEYHYTEQGSGEECILMVHGFGGSHKNFELVSELLSDSFRVICIDLPAFGLSSVPQENVLGEEMFALYRKFIASSLDKLNISSCHLVGNSLGGWISWDLASSQDPRIKSLTLLNSAGYGMDRVKSNASSWMTGPFAKFLFKKGVPYRMTLSNARRVLWDDTKVNEEKVRLNYYMMNKEGTFDWMLNMVASAVIPDTTLLLSVNCPSLIIWGDQDEVVPAEHAASFERDIPNSAKIIYENCGHVPQIEYPERFVADWKAFYHQNFPKEVVLEADSLLIPQSL